MKKNILNLNYGNKKGFTLIELLLVVSLIGIAFGVTTDVLISLVRSQTKTQVMNNLEQQANFFSLKLEKDLRNAYTVEVNGSGDGITISGKTNGVPYQTIYNLTSGVVYRQGDGLGSPLPVTSNTVPGGVTVSCTAATCFSVTGANPVKVSVNMRFSPVITGSEAITPTSTGSVDIQSTFVVRGSY